MTTRALYYPDETEYIAEVGASYPDKGIANWEEGRCLFTEFGYNILDIRCQAEIDQIGNFPREYPSDHRSGARFVEVPLIFANYRYNSELNKKMMMNQESNKEFLDKVAKVFPDKNEKIIVACSDGRNRAIQALEALDEAGYVNIVGLRGGYNMWNRTWDAKMRRRNLPVTSRKSGSTALTGAACTPPVPPSRTRMLSSTPTGRTRRSGSNGPVKYVHVASSRWRKKTFHHFRRGGSTRRGGAASIDSASRGPVDASRETRRDRVND